MSNITSGYINFNTSKLVSDATHRELTRRCPIEIGDVLYSTVGSYGIPAVVEVDTKFSFQRHIAHIKPDCKILDSYFLWIALRSAGVRNQADRAARGAAQKTLNLSEISKFVIPVPAMSDQRIFVSELMAIEAQRALYQDHLAQLEALYASVQHRAFRGELWDKPAA